MNINMAKYIETTESIEDKIDELSKKEEKPVEASLLRRRWTSWWLSLSPRRHLSFLALSLFVEEVNGADKVAIATASAMEKFSEKLKLMLEILVQRSRKVDDTLRGKVNDFYNMQSAKLDSALLKVCTKVEDSPPTPVTCIIWG